MTSADEEAERAAHERYKDKVIDGFVEADCYHAAHRHGFDEGTAHAREAVDLRTAALERVAEAARVLDLALEGSPAGNLRTALRALDQLKDSGGSDSDHSYPVNLAREGRAGTRESGFEPASSEESDEAIVDSLVAKRTAEMKVRRYLTRSDLARLCQKAIENKRVAGIREAALMALAEAAESEDE